MRVVLETKRGSVSLLQRRLTIGYSRASRLIEAMAASGIVGAYKGSQAREALITVEEWEAMQAQQTSRCGERDDRVTAQRFRDRHSTQDPQNRSKRTAFRDTIRSQSNLLKYHLFA